MRMSAEDLKNVNKIEHYGVNGRTIARIFSITVAKLQIPFK